MNVLPKLRRASDTDHPRAAMHRRMGRGDILVAYMEADTEDFPSDPCPARVVTPERRSADAP